MTKTWILDSETYSETWPEDQESDFWLLDKSNLTLALKAARSLMEAINVDDDPNSDLYYCFLISDISITLSEMVQDGKMFSIKLIDKPFTVKLPNTSINIERDNSDQSKIMSGIFYFIAKLLLELTADSNPSDTVISSYMMPKTNLKKIKKLLSEYAVS